jgi:hypothetical protein
MTERLFYEVFGLRIASEIFLPELFPSPAGEADVEIRFATIPATAEEPPGLSLEPAGARLHIPGVGRYLMRGGRELLVDPAPQGSERNLRLYLLGSAFAAILHQRGLLPLHANAIEIEGRAVAFMGHSGAGKSTLAAWFHDRGFRVLSDDVCVVTPAPPVAQGGIARLRLWREALEASGRTREDYELSFDDMDKYTVPITDPDPRPLPLGAIYLLRQAERPALRRLQGVEAVEALVANTYRGAYVKMMGLTRRHLEDCLRLAAQVPVFAADRRWGFERFDVEAEALATHARSVLADPIAAPTGSALPI